MIICKQAFTRRYSSVSIMFNFVAIANSVDSDDQNSNEFAPFLNIMNEWYTILLLLNFNQKSLSLF